MKTKLEAINFAITQLTEDLLDKAKYGKWHYGKLEVYALLDYIYVESESPNVPEPNGPIEK